MVLGAAHIKRALSVAYIRTCHEDLQAAVYEYFNYIKANFPGDAWDTIAPYFVKWLDGNHAGYTAWEDDPLAALVMAHVEADSEAAARIKNLIEAAAHFNSAAKRLDRKTLGRLLPDIFPPTQKPGDYKQ